MNKIITILLLSLLVSVSANSQELDCTLLINSDQVSSKEGQVFEQMQQDLFEFVNNQRWTEDVVAPEERIKFELTNNYNNKEFLFIIFYFKNE